MVGPRPERLHREVQAVLRDYGFVEEPGLGQVMFDNDTNFFELRFYEGKGLDESDIEKIVERLDSACRGCRVREPESALWGMEWASSDSEHPQIEVNVYKNYDDGVVSMDVKEYTKDTSSPWDRLRSWLPW